MVVVTGRAIRRVRCRYDNKSGVNFQLERGKVPEPRDRAKLNLS